MRFTGPVNANMHTNMHSTAATMAARPTKSLETAGCSEYDEQGGVGALLGADIVHQVGDRILIQARAQLRWAGERSVGPFESVGWSGERVSFRREPIGFNHGVLMVGLGIQP